MNKTRVLAAMLALSLCACSLTACGRSTDEEVTQTSPTTITTTPAPTTTTTTTRATTPVLPDDDSIGDSVEDGMDRVEGAVDEAARGAKNAADRLMGR